MRQITQTVPEASGTKAATEASDNRKHAKDGEEVEAFLKLQAQKAEEFKKAMSGNWRTKLAELKGR